ncbi:MAG: ribosomal protein S18-alanine N-acetyltransferase [Synergistaceae bacterium]|jgi:ribosomal-protein-alanine N-acetyltransferase|nr:ribosomal protein S18-alanine N-acetyltransferase [Synergistaceae bacterium]
MQIADLDFCVPKDLKSLVEIEKVCFADPWEESLIASDLDGRGNSVYLKASFRDIIVGYGVLGQNDGGAHLMNLAVLPEYRRHGVALQIMAAFDVLASDWLCKRMYLEVRASNTGARAFYAALGFVYSSRVKGYYRDGEDALVLAARLPLKL